VLTKRHKYTTPDVNDDNGASGARGEQKKMRRSITVIEKNHKALLKARGELMALLETDADYTTSLNLFLELGLKRYNSRTLSEDEKRIILGYLADENLRNEARLDDLTEWFNEQLRRQYMVQNQQASTSQSK
jgi:hypothetical protein